MDYGTLSGLEVWIGNKAIIQPLDTANRFDFFIFVLYIMSKCHILNGNFS